jgi:hypothetical protein
MQSEVSTWHFALCSLHFSAAFSVQPAVEVAVNDHAGRAPVWQAEKAME